MQEGSCWVFGFADRPAALGWVFSGGVACLLTPCGCFRTKGQDQATMRRNLNWKLLEGLVSGRTSYVFRQMVPVLCFQLLQGKLSCQWCGFYWLVKFQMTPEGEEIQWCLSDSPVLPHK